MVFCLVVWVFFELAASRRVGGSCGRGNLAAISISISSSANSVWLATAPAIFLGKSLLGA